MERATWTHRLNCPQHPLPGYQPPVPSVICCCHLFLFLFSTSFSQSYHIPRGAPSSVLHSARHHPSLGISSHSHGEVMPGLFHDASGKVAHEVRHVYIHACLHALEVTWGAWLCCTRALWKLRGGVALLRMTWACQRGHLCGFRKSLHAGSGSRAHKQTAQ